jgi:hypothetical protein
VGFNGVWYLLVVVNFSNKVIEESNKIGFEG